MTDYSFIVALTMLSVITSLVTEAVKDTLDSVAINYSANIVAGVVSIICGAVYCIVYPIMFPDILVDERYFVSSCILVVMAWVGSMVGYDKMIQTLKQLGGK